VAVTIDIGLTDHLIHLLVGQLFAEVGHDVSQFGCGNESVSVSIEDLEGLNELLFCVCIFHFSCHEGQEFREVDGSISIGIHLIDHVLKLSFGGVLSQRSHHCS
jgi:hypothetical protein